jgi:hypothetical protein
VVPRAVDAANAADLTACSPVREAMLEASGRSDAPTFPATFRTRDTERISLPLPEALAPAVAVAAAVPTPGRRPRHPTDAAVRRAAHEPERNPLERAELFDLGIALRAQHRYIEALDAWGRR